MATTILISTIVKVLSKRTDVSVNGLGNTVYRDHGYDCERYIVDFADDFKSDGWQQFDTDQDAWYFGVWVNPRQLCTLTYAEGDFTLVTCPSTNQYRAQVESMIEFYGESKIATAIDADGTVPVYRQDRDEFLPSPN